MSLSNEKLRRLVQELELKDKARLLTDGELAKALINEIWTRLPLWTWPAVLVDETITRLKRADTRRRWQKRKERRAKKSEQQST